MDHLTKLEEMLDQANTEIRNGKYDAASNILEKIIDINPDFGKAYNHLAFMYDTKFKEYDKAETLYKLCLEKAPMYPAGYINYAIMLSILRRFDDLKSHLDTAINIPGVAKSTVYYEYGIMYEQTGKFELAIDNYKKCGLQSMDQATIDRVKKAIARCKSKEEFL